MELASDITKPGTHSHVFKLLIVPEVNDIQSPFLELFAWPVWVRYNKIFTGEMYNPDFLRTELLSILEHLLEMTI